MKNSVIFASLLAVASTAATSENAIAATSDIILQENLRQAVCFQDWDSAVELSSHLITSATITPEYRQNLVTWRYQFIEYSTANTSFAKIPNCEGGQLGAIDIEIRSYRTAVPRFSNRPDLVNGPKCYMERSNGQFINLTHLCN